MAIPLSGWDEFREEMQPYIDKAYKQVITFEEFDQTLKQKMKELHEKYDRKTNEFTGKVVEREIDYGNDLEFVTDVRDEKDNSLSDVLDDFIGEKVKITIEVID